ncbi:MAG TPA: hypothetical protein VFG47_08800 [Geminicoccaceae bacterium]|nr:hypothetical protein [Geminicoccaceae bacterium]
MNRTFVGSIIAAAIGAAVATPAAAEPPTKFSFKGETASAYFVSTSDCVETVTYVEAGNGLTRSGPGQKEASSWVNASVYQYDFCAEQYLHEIFGYDSLDAAAFVVSGGGRSATLAATVEAYDYATGSTVTLDLDLSWNAPGTAFMGHSSYYDRGPSYSYRSKFVGRFRDATAAGTVSDETTNYTPEPSEGASIGTSTYGEMFITRH